MILKQKPTSPVLPAAPATADVDEQDKVLRQKLYERIARGSAIAEAEVYARRKWGGRS